MPETQPLIEESVFFLGRARDGTLVERVEVIDGNWNEAALWCWLAVQQYEERVYGKGSTQAGR